MRTVWNITAYLKSEMPLTTKVVSVFSVSLVVIAEDAPSKDLIQDLVSAHTRNSTLLLSEVTQTAVPDAIISGLH